MASLLLPSSSAAFTLAPRPPLAWRFQLLMLLAVVVVGPRVFDGVVVLVSMVAPAEAALCW